MGKFTQSQQNVIDYRGKNMLVSASAGTGKTTVMIERIAKLIAEGADVSTLVVVTFTNLAAAEMKNRLAAKLSEFHGDRRIVEQLEKLDTAAICTLHSFCGELLRNYFYVVDIDPSFAILDNVTVDALRANALDEVFHDYFRSKDEVFKKVYKIFATNRKEENFKQALMSLYNFSRCLENFPQWYAQKRQKFEEYSETNPIVTTIVGELNAKISNLRVEMAALAYEFSNLPNESFANVCSANAEALRSVDFSTLQSALDGVYTLNISTLGRAKKGETPAPETLRERFSDCKKKIDELQKTYGNLCRGKTVAELWEETRQSAQYTDKLVEILQRFDEKFFLAKKQRGGVDFNDLEHLTLQLLSDEETLAAIRQRYAMVFVDEYQDTNPVQEAIISRISSNCQLFMVGDIKQSIYAFRGCDPTIFLRKYQTFKSFANNPQLSAQNHVEELNKNFRSNGEILQFVNDVFDVVMTENFGKVNYQETSRLEGDALPTLKTASVQLDFVLKDDSAEKPEAQEMYDVTKQTEVKEKVSQGDVIAANVSRFVGMAYKDKNGQSQRIKYGDIVVLLRSMKDNAVEIFNKLTEHNIPVSANFKTQSYANKEVRDLINLLRAIDNPYNDVYTVGACLCPIGGFCENDLAQIKIFTNDQRIPFFARMTNYLQNAPQDEISQKIHNFVQLLNDLRFYSHSATVDEVVLKVLEKTRYNLYVQGYPNGALRLRKLYAFIDSLKGASFAQSISKFLYFLDQSDETSEENVANANAVRIMTMHASKGLEFPVVIIADANHGFNGANNSGAIVRNTDFGLAMKYYNFEEMRVYDTLATCACGMYNRKNLQEEEMRLLYVALTRAKFVLNVVGTVSAKDVARKMLPNAANSHLDWILLALRNKYGDWVNAETTEKISLITEKPYAKPTQAEDLLCKQYTNEDEVLQKLAYRYPFANQTQMPSKIVSSALDREFIDADSDRADFVLHVNNDRNALGTAYHKVYQYVNYNASKAEIAQTVQGLVNEGKINSEMATKLDLSLIWQTLNNAQLRQLMQQGEVYHEMPFMLVAPYNAVAKDQRFSDDVMLQGVIDLLVIGQNKATVVDFKFSTHSEDILRADYQKQLASYRLAVEKICGIHNVDCYILSILENKLIRM
ncbi:MAG: UvrD-helicase domain-containing protein [Candidatus Fimimonas sp.]